MIKINNIRHLPYLNQNLNILRLIEMALEISLKLISSGSIPDYQIIPDIVYAIISFSGGRHH